MKRALGNVIACVGLFVIVGCAIARGDNQDAQPSADEAKGAQGALTRQSSVNDILDALDRRGRDLRSLSADVKLTDTDLALNDNTARSGWFKLQNRADGSTRARIVFDRKTVDERTISEMIEYALNDGVLIDRNYARTKQTTRRVLRPGEKVNLLKLGEGPFPLPIGQKREEVLAQFDVAKIESAVDDPAGTVHLQLVAKPKTPFARKFKSIDSWIKLDDALPVRIKTVDFNGMTERTTDLSNVQINRELQDADFALPKIDASWDVTEEAFQDGRGGG